MLALACFAVGCRNAPRAARPSVSPAARLVEAPVPAQAPDSIPAWLFAPGNLVRDPPGLAGRSVKNAITVLFMPGVSVEAKAAAISMVNGRVVGGYPQEFGEGLYYVTVPADSTAWTMLRAIDRLNRLPQVAGATVVFAETAESQLDTSRRNR
jgi:hypothetical protein